MANMGRSTGKKLLRSQSPDLKLKKPNCSLILKELVTFSNEDFYRIVYEKHRVLSSLDDALMILRSQFIDVITPMLHHPSTFFQILLSMICRTNFILFLM